MKIRFYLLLFACLLFNLLSADGQAKRTVIAGVLPYLANDAKTVSIWLYDENNMIDPARFVSVKLQSGRFSIDVDMESIHSFTIAVDGENLLGYDSIGITGSLLIASPGDSLHFFVPTQSSRLFSEITASGRGSEKYDFLRSINSKLKRHYAKTRGQNGIDQSLKARDIISRVFVEEGSSLSVNAASYINSQLMGLLNLSCVLTLDAMKSAKMDVTSSLENYLRNFPVKEMCYDNQGRISYGDAIVKRAILAHSIKNPNENRLSTSDITRILLDQYKNENFLSRVCVGFLIERAKSVSWTDDIDKAANSYFSVLNKNDIWKSQLLEFKASVTSNLAPGTYALSYKLVDDNEKVFDLESLKGKVVLIDFMFYGCGGCIQIAPVLDDLKTKLATDEVVLVSISTDQTPEKFRKSIGKYSANQSVHLYTARQGTSHPIVKDFGIIMYPTLILIGRDGRIISGRAPDPRTKQDQDKLYNLIVGAL